MAEIENSKIGQFSLAARSTSFSKRPHWIEDRFRNSDDNVRGSEKNVKPLTMTAISHHDVLYFITVNLKHFQVVT